MSKENVIPIKGYSEQLNAEHDWWVFPSSVDTNICKQIITLGEDKWKDAKITNSLQSEEKLNKTIRDTQVTFCDEDWLYKIVWDYLHTANKKSNWNFQIDSCESMQIGKYGVGGHYDYHQDGNGFTKYVSKNKFTNGKTRKLSMTIVLNNDYEGGEFQFFNYKDQLIKEKKGTVIVFPSYMVHRVRPVTKGTRYSLVVWFCGEPLT